MHHYYRQSVRFEGLSQNIWEFRAKLKAHLIVFYEALESNALKEGLDSNDKTDQSESIWEIVDKHREDITTNHGKYRAQAFADDHLTEEIRWTEKAANKIKGNIQGKKVKNDKDKIKGYQERINEMRVLISKIWVQREKKQELDQDDI